MKIMSEISVMCIFTSKVKHIKWHRWPAFRPSFSPFHFSLVLFIYSFFSFSDALAAAATAAAVVPFHLEK